MARVVYNVPLVRQLNSHICWVACMAMVASERLSKSIAISRYTNGFDPINSSIPNPASSMIDFVSRMSYHGFASVAINATVSELQSVLQNCGPIILTHFCAGFPYGGTWLPIIDRPNQPPSVHSVVITGMDTAVNGGMCWMNNPWGDKDRPIATTSVLNAINRMQASSAMPVGYFRA